MSQRPKISLIIPVFNTEKYLDDCLSSAVNQTLHDIEIICIDDKSNDNSLEILKKYAKQDKRLKIIEKDFSSGAGDCRNRGLELAQGEYVLFIDSDDKIKTEACEDLYNEAQKYDADICIFGAEFYNTDRSEYNLAPAKYKPYFLDEIKKFLPTMKFLKNFSLESINDFVSFRERYIVFTFGRMTFKFKKSTFFLRLFYLCFRKKLGRFNSFEKLSFKEYEQSILKTYKELTGDNLYFASNLDIK